MSAPVLPRGHSSPFLVKLALDALILNRHRPVNFCLAALGFVVFILFFLSCLGLFLTTLPPHGILMICKGKKSQDRNSLLLLLLLGFDSCD